MTRKEHLDWCKQRAGEYAEKGEIENAFASFQSDMSKHEETANHTGLEMMMPLYLGGHLSTPQKMKDFINGFN